MIWALLLAGLASMSIDRVVPRRQETPAQAESAIWQSPSGLRIRFPEPWRVLDKESLARPMRRARIEQLKTALGGSPRRVETAGLPLTTWSRIVDESDAVLVTGASIGDATFVRVFDRDETFSPRDVAERPASRALRLRVGDRYLTVAMHGALATGGDVDRLLDHIADAVESTTERPVLPAPARGSRRAIWIALLPFAILAGWFLYTKKYS
ncbi:MAG: hypothetical protein H6832_07960 [Planctomycetes bacterium]|nr:hypothetical protein [Planctomycetota bacterium]MCB9918324.1 hypothetical protein [Planctomycetota bacterium]